MNASRKLDVTTCSPRRKVKVERLMVAGGRAQGRKVRNKIG